MSSRKKIKKTTSKASAKLAPTATSVFSQVSISKSPTQREICELLDQKTNELINKRCKAKSFHQSTANCTSRGPARPGLVDLVILIDTSGSMGDEAQELSDKANAAIAKAKQSCPADLQVTWLGIEGTWAGTSFTQTHRDYLTSAPISTPPGNLNARLGLPPEGSKEEGANAIRDLIAFFDWRAGAARLIFYLSDEGLAGGDPQTPEDVLAVDQAIAAANASNPKVKVFTYLGTPGTDLTLKNEYERLSTGTGGLAFTSVGGDIDNLQSVLEQVICSPDADRCKVSKPIIEPCLNLSWGDGKNDRIETDDWEILCITACNPYSNVILRDFMVHLIVTDADGKLVEKLPDGSPSVLVRPEYQICFGDLQPCDSKDDKKTTCVSREVVMITRGALAKGYRLNVIYCFEACQTYAAAIPAFKFELVSS